MPRIFVAIPLPPQAAADVARVFPPLPGLRPVATELLHVTLAFVGQVAEERVADVIAAAEAGARGSSAFAIGLEAIGRFPQHGPPTVIWAGAAGPAADAIVRLGGAVRAQLLRWGVPFDPKPLRAHVTVARVQGGVTDEQARDIEAAARSARIDGAITFRAEALHVMESRLSPRGPLYSSRARIPLAGRAR